MANDFPVITVIMPVFNSEMFLKDAIDSVINQTFKDWELICVNDGSSDNSLSILREYEALDNRITVFDQKNSGTASAARNKALEKAKGKFTHMLDSDDVFGESCLEKTYERAITTQADFVIPDLIFFKNKPNNTLLKLVGYEGDREAILSPNEGFIASLTWKISGVGIYRTELLRKFGYDETGINGDEYSTRMLMLNCNKIAFCSGAYFYRKHPDSTTSKISSRRFDTLFTDFKLLELAYRYKVGKEAIVLCKKRIIENIMFSERFYLGVKKHFNETEKKEIQKLIRANYDKINQSFIVYRRNILKYLITKAVFADFRILKAYGYGVNCLKFLLNRKYQ